MNHKIGIIVNPNSKLNKQNPKILQKIRDIVGDLGIVSVTQSLDDVYEIANQFKNSNVKILGLNGGDGTIASTLGIFASVYKDQPLPNILILKGGTINVLAKNLSLKGSCLDILQRFINTIKRNDPNTLKTHTYSSLNVDQNYGFLYADGVAVNFLELFYKNKTNALGSALLMTKAFGSALIGGQLYKSLCYQSPITLQAKNFEPIEHKSSMIMAASIERIPYGISMFKELRGKTDLMQFFSVTSTPRQVPLHFPSLLLRSNDGRSTGKFGFCCEELKLTSDHTYRYTLDGELFTSKTNSITIKLGSKVNFVVV